MQNLESDEIKLKVATLDLKIPFLNDLDELVMNRDKLVSAVLYNLILERQGKLLDYFALDFILKNYNRFNQ